MSSKNAPESHQILHELSQRKQADTTKKRKQREEPHYEQENKRPKKNPPEVNNKKINARTRRNRNRWNKNVSKNREQRAKESYENKVPEPRPEPSGGESFKGSEVKVKETKCGMDDDVILMEPVIPVVVVEDSFTEPKGDMLNFEDPSDKPVLPSSAQNCTNNLREPIRCNLCGKGGHKENRCAKNVVYLKEGLQEGMPYDPEEWEAVEIDREESCMSKTSVNYRDPRCHNKICSSCAPPVNYTPVFCHNCAKQCNGNTECDFCHLKGHTSSFCPDRWQHYYHPTTQHFTLNPLPTLNLIPPSLWQQQRGGTSTDSNRGRGHRVNSDGMSLFNSGKNMPPFIFRGTTNQPSMFDPMMAQQVCNLWGSVSQDSCQRIPSLMQNNIHHTAPIVQKTFTRPNHDQNYVLNLNNLEQRVEQKFLTLPQGELAQFLDEEIKKLSGIKPQEIRVFQEKLKTVERLKGIENKTDLVERQISLEFKRFNMYLFGVLQLDFGKHHLDYLRNFIINGGKSLPKLKRLDLRDSYGYIFGGEHPGLDYGKYLKRY